MKSGLLVLLLMLLLTSCVLKEKFGQLGDKQSIELGKEYSIIYDPFCFNGKIVFSALSGSERFVVIGGQEGKHYDDTIDNLKVMPDGQLKYVGTKDKKKYVVISGKEFGPYDEVNSFGKTDSPAFVVKHDGKESVLFNGTEGPQFDHVHSGREELEINGLPLYTVMKGSPGTKGYKEAIVFGNKIGKFYNHVNLPDSGKVVIGNAVVYSAKNYPPYEGSRLPADRAEKYVIIGDKELGPFKEDTSGSDFFGGGGLVVIGDFVYFLVTEDRAALTENDTILYRNAQQIGAYDWASFAPIDVIRSKSASFDMLVFSVGRNHKQHLVIGDREIETNETSLHGGFQPEFYLADNKVVWEDEINGKHRVLVDGAPSREFDDIRITYNHDNSALAYDALVGNEVFFVEAGKKEYGPYDKGNLTFPGTNHILLNDSSYAHVGRRNGKEFIVVHDKEGPEFDKITSLTPIGSNVYYIGAKNGKLFVMKNEQVVGEHEQVYVPSSKYTRPSFIVDINGTPAYFIEENGKKVLIFGDEKGTPYDEIYWELENYDGKVLINDGKPVYHGKIGDDWFLVVGLDPSLPYYGGGKVIIVDGKLTYVAEENGQEWVVSGGLKSKKYHNIVGLNEVCGKITFQVGTNKKYQLFELI